MPRYLYRDDCFEQELAATNLDDAIAEAEQILAKDIWIDRPLLSTVQLYAEVVEVTVDEDGPYEVSYEIDVTFDPDEPDCIDSNGHDWKSPHHLFGDFNGETFTKEACVRCGCERTTDTWGLDTITYSPGKYDEDDLNTSEEFSEYIEEDD
jgi:hypothetical protein